MTVIDKKTQKGAAALEFALILPLLLTIIFFMLECFWMTTTQMLLNYSVFQGVKSAMTAKEWLGENPVDKAVYATKNSFWFRDLDETEIYAAISVSQYGQRYIEVIIPEYHYDPLTGFLPNSMLPDTLRAKARGELP